MPVIHTHSEPGGHVVNEDAFEVRPHPRDPACRLVAVADGQGGQAGGGAAARTACRAFVEGASGLAPEKLRDPRAWNELMCNVDDAVLKEPRAGLTALVALCVAGDELRGSSCGDTEGQAKRPPAGSGFARFVNFAAELRSPWTLVAMTDGVWKYAGWQKVIAALALDSPEEIVASLRGASALPTGGLQDDLTLVVLRDE
jgi:hypothetical protein